MLNFFFKILKFPFYPAGLLQFILAKNGCADNDHLLVNPCPLPREFNHNALMHLMIMVTSCVYFAAELASIRRRKRLCCRRDSGSGGDVESANGRMSESEHVMAGPLTVV